MSFRRMGSGLYSLRHHPGLLVSTVAWAIGTTIFVNDCVCEVLSIDGLSMVPTLSPQYNETGQMDYVLFQKWRPAANVKRGDILAFWSPLKADHLIVKRVIATEGDTVTLDKKRRPNDEKEAKDWDLLGQWDWSTGEKHDESAAAPDGPATVRVPWGHVWIEGDNWRASRDSNTYGPVSKSLIVGKAKFCVRPLSKFGTTPWDKLVNATKVKEGECEVPEEWLD